MIALKPLEQIAYDACEMIGDGQQKRYHGFLMKRMALGFQQMHLFMTPAVTVKTFCAPFNNIIEMPAGFVYETKVGILKDGVLVLLTKDYRDDSNFIQNNSDSETSKYIDDCFYDYREDYLTPFYNNSGSGILYARGGGVNNEGLYTVDKTNGRINLGSNFPRDCQIVIEYKSDGLTEGLELVPSEMSGALEAYGLRDYYRKKRDFTMIREYEKEYDEQWYMLKSLYQFKPIEYYTEILNTIDRGTINDLI